MSNDQNRPQPPHWEQPAPPQQWAQPPVVPTGASGAPQPQGYVPSAVPVAQQQVLVPATTLSDGEWHRMHPLTPLLQGGFVLIAVGGIVIANLKDRIIGLFMPANVRDYGYDGDPINWVLANNLWMLVLGGVLLLTILFIGGFYMSWRFHTFRISDTAVEVKKGILSRSQRRAPLDRVQGVNLTRPFIARLIGLAKLEIVGAGADANVQLEYLATSNAEKVRADILLRASGIREAKVAAQQPTAAGQTGFATRVAHTVTDGAAGIVMGVDNTDIASQSVVRIPVGRLIGSHLVGGALFGLLAFIAIMIVISVTVTPYVLFGMLPAVIGIGAYTVSTIMKTLRYSIAPTRDGVRVTFGLTTTVTETIPPGRIHAIQVSQSLLWRPFGWYAVRINRMSGKSAQQQANGQSDPFTTILPVGTIHDVRRVLQLMIPELTDEQATFIFLHGMMGPQPNDPFTVSPRRAWWILPLSIKRNGFFVAPGNLLMRRGQVSRQLAIFPLARTQSLTMRQGPLDRLARVGKLQVNVVPGLVSALLTAIDRDALLNVFAEAEREIILAGRHDTSHRWAELTQAAASPLEVPQAPTV